MLIIGEKINATRKEIARAIEERDAAAISEIARREAEAGADVIDVNSSLGKADRSKKIEDMLWAVDVAQKACAKPLAIDSDSPEVMAAGLAAVAGPAPWINSVNAEQGKMEGVLTLAKKFGGPLVALCMGDAGIPSDIEGRIKAAGAIWEAGRKMGIEPERFYFDPLVMPLGTDHRAGLTILESLREIKKQFPGARTVLGLSNVSFGLPLRAELNAIFLALCMGAGLDAAILDPTNTATMTALRAADALLSGDDFCMRFLKHYRSIK